ncbi:glutaredoxin family protein [Candidatus Bathyarchaeota archaeon]|nr:glutaredoxin family protein [Candidatus Bathyarchaeota archaeon]
MVIVKVEGERKSHKVFLYTLSTCGWCKKTKELLNQSRVEYEYIDVDLLKADERKAALDEIHNRKAPLGFPVIIIDDTVVITGYVPEKIKEAIGL